jgi:hypothetical protein
MTLAERIAMVEWLLRGDVEDMPTLEQDEATVDALLRRQPEPEEKPCRLFEEPDRDANMVWNLLCLECDR